MLPMRRFFGLLALPVLTAVAVADDAPLYSVKLDPGKVAREDALVAIAHGLENVPPNASGALFFRSGEEEALQADLDPADRKTLWLRVPGQWPANQILELSCRAWVQDTKSPEEDPKENFSFKDPSGRELFLYQAKTNPAPEGTSPLFARSAFIHPLTTPAGHILTGTRPSDHIHHMGLWHAWTQTNFRGEKVDFWNIKEGQGTVRFASYDWRHRGRAWSGFSAKQEHIAWPGQARETRVLDESLVVRAWTTAKALVLDYNFTQKNVSDAPLELTAYRYGGGLGFRGRPEWRLETSDYLTSEGKTRENAHQSRARWLGASGTTGDATKGSVVLLSHPENTDSPQRIRTWGKEHEGAIFMNFVPTQEKASSIAPGASITLRYRVITMDGGLDKTVIEAIWDDYANPVRVGK
ncbi:MAG: PmoA family protein [Verrucomicrobiales bacterium]